MGCTTVIDDGKRRAHWHRARAVVRAAVVMGVIGLVMLTPTELEASCVMATSCQVYESSAVVVQGTVTELTDVDLGTEMIGGRAYQRVETLVTIDVEKAWKGATPGTPVQIYTDGKRSSVGFEFVRGQRYLVFAYDRGGRLQTSICSHTNLIDKAGDDLAFLETLSSPASGGRVYGRVTLDQRAVDMGERPAPLRAVSGRRVSLEGSSGVREAVTLEDGRYVFEGLPPGTYELDADLPKGWSRSGLPRSMTLATMRSCMEANISTAIDGRLSGHIVGADGLPLARVQVEAAPLERLRRSATPTMSPNSAMTDARGRFELDRLPPGRYIVGVHVTRAANDYAPYRFAAYPGTTQTDPPSAIALDTAQQLDLGVLTVARLQSKRAIEGRVSWTDGRPVMAPRILVTEIRPDWAGPEVRFAGPIRVDADGRFTMELYEGVSYRIVAEASLMRRPSALPTPDGAGAAQGAAQGSAPRPSPESGTAQAGGAQAAGPQAAGPQAGRAILVPGGGRGAFSFGAVPRIRSNAVDLTVNGELPIVTLVLDEAKGPKASPER